MDSAISALLTREKLIANLDQSTSKELKNAQREREHFQFKRNLSATFEIKTFELTNAALFSELLWDLNPRINILLGRNGFGKSLLLRLMVGMLAYDDDRLTTLLSESGEGHRLAVRLLHDGSPSSVVRDRTSFSFEVGKIPILAIPDSRFINRARDGFSAEGDDSDPARDGARHFLYELPYETRLQTVLAQMCIDYINTRDGRSAARTKPSTPQLELVSSVIQELSGERFQFQRIEPIGNARFSIEVETDASPGRAIPFQRASQGTLSVVAIFALIYQFLKAVHASVPEPELHKQRGIVVIDEVDAHLHPAWQRRIVDLLRKHFPNIQFMLTAHNPLVVAGCRSGEVTLLRRENANLRLVDFQRDFVGATSEEIYRQVFEVEDRDVRFLELQAQLPQLPELIKTLEDAKKKSRPAAELGYLEETIDAIKRTNQEQKMKIAYETLQQENEQLRRQVQAAQRKLAGSSGA